MSTVEKAFILYRGEDPGVSAIQQMINEFEQDTGIKLAGTALNSIGFRGPGPEPDTDLALAVAARLEGTGELSAGSLERTVSRTIVVQGRRYVLAAVLAADRKA